MIHQVPFVIQSVRVVFFSELLQEISATLSLFAVVLINLFSNSLTCMSTTAARLVSILQLTYGKKSAMRIWSVGKHLLHQQNHASIAQQILM